MYMYLLVICLKTNVLLHALNWTCWLLWQGWVFFNLTWAVNFILPFWSIACSVEHASDNILSIFVSLIKTNLLWYNVHVCFQITLYLHILMLVNEALWTFCLAPMGRMKFLEMEGPQQCNCKYMCICHSLSESIV